MRRLILLAFLANVSFSISCTDESCEKPEWVPECCEHEVYDNCINAICRAQNCSQLGKPVACPSVTTCYEGCACKSGYLRNHNGTCVPENKCHLRRCGKNEVHNDCVQSQCGPKTCKQLGQPLSCPRIDPKFCKKGCLCKNDYVRAENGTCILKRQCPSCGGDPNAQSGRGGHCNNRCSTYNKPPKPCPEISEINGCDCKEGFIFDDVTKKCVLPCDCTKPVCPKNEIPSDCVNGGCDKRNCSQLKQPAICIDPSECFKGCVCKKDYLRADNGTCVPMEECYSSTCCKNEVYSNCTNQNCTPTKCSELGKPLSCLTTDRGPCKAGCMCRDGYVKDDNNICIPIGKCPSCGGDSNATTGCSVNCGRHCSDYNKGPVACPAICLFNGCDCKKGYVYDSNTGKCVFPEDCTPTCGENEIYSNCTNQYCKPSECSQLGKPLFCPATGIRPCISGCMCQEGYVRAENKTCIPKKECPSCGGDPNAQSGRGDHCNNRCSTYNKPPKPCPKICETNGCDCKEGFTYDDVTKKCVLPCDCTTPVCGKNEIPSDCVNGGCDKRNCSQLGQPKICIDPLKCFKGCVCKKNYLRADNGICVPEEECYCQKPVNTTTGNNTSSSNATVALAQLRRANLAMTGAFLNLIYDENPSSFVFSAISCLTALAVISLVAVGETGKQLINDALQMQNKDQVREAFIEYGKLFEELGNVTIESGVMCYGNIQYPFSDSFKKEVQDVFDAEIENLDFANPQMAANEINEWVANKTRNLIPSIIEPDMLDKNTILVLLNVIYFLGNWEKPFNKDNTQKKDFYVTPNETQSIDFMQQESSFDYRDNDELQAQALRMNYQGDIVSFIIYLPYDRDGLPNMMKKLQNTDVFERSMESFSKQRVNVIIPKFKIETSLNLKDLLMKYNITKMFSNGAEFQGMLKYYRDVKVTDAIQKAEIIFDEKGTEAAVVTAIIVGATAAIYPEPKIVLLDAKHPFCYCVVFKDNLMFCGVFAGQQ
ncbi:hypothetical protein K1T71_004593 [Dendrolimus kikuchii]|uniref:Uncharacterized protein n=1 Tax=Dendrolimus kikuchii TaxID=765133 RepID=A0ACC1D814_9NEOP|nr:hypothetical protein K1T71_004593 [Dendrolimus kikuchii]